MAPQAESQSLAITNLTKEPREPVTKKQKQRKGARVVANEAGSSAGRSGVDAEGHKKQKPKSFCAASAALT